MISPKLRLIEAIIYQKVASVKANVNSKNLKTAYNSHLGGVFGVCSRAGAGGFGRACQLQEGWRAAALVSACGVCSDSSARNGAWRETVSAGGAQAGVDTRRPPDDGLLPPAHS